MWIRNEKIGDTYPHACETLTEPGFRYILLFIVIVATVDLVLVVLTLLLHSLKPRGSNICCLVLCLRARPLLATRRVDICARAKLVLRMLPQHEIVLLARDGNASLEHRRLAALSVDLAATLGDEFAVGCGVVDAIETLLVWTCEFCGLRRTSCEKVTTDDCKVGKKLASLRVRKNEGEQCTKVLYGCESGSIQSQSKVDGVLTLLAIGLHLVLLHRDDLVRILLRPAGINIAGVPQEILEQLVGVLLLDHLARGLDDITDILDELLAIWAEFADVDERVVADIGKGLVDLVVVGVAALTERLDDAVKAELDIGEPLMPPQMAK